jgi:hypothetical protein
MPVLQCRVFLRWWSRATRRVHMLAGVCVEIRGVIVVCGKTIDVRNIGLRCG